ncbi:hypothetical protein D0860_08439 [Hortaea werneckii]|uniref:Alpha-galactosidase n=1 Tax=Hortaea werneckii TaxID=91943 RepID=A0A3M7GD72_HORWE|nr:alpha-galactosidase [Hortaea werneckii]RMY98787.1 hypothetical protein D0860_08439 [Hortaea werneckii]
MAGFKAWAALSTAGAALAAGNAITADGTNFTMTAEGMSYLFHVDPETLDLTHDHFGGPTDDFIAPANVDPNGWVTGLSNVRREFPDIGRSDFRLPAIHITHGDGSTVTALLYESHEVMDGKPEIPGLPATFGNSDDVSTLQVKLYDNYSDIGAMLSYSVFPKSNAIARSFQITNNCSETIHIERGSSFSIDLPNIEDLEMLELAGDWANERHRVRHPIRYGETGFRSTTGYTSHLHNNFFALMPSTTTESAGEAWGFGLIWTGSFQAMAEKFSNGFVRVLLGLNPLHSSIPVQPGETFYSPEAVGIYSSKGLNEMSQSFHRLYRNNLSRSNKTFSTRPVLLNSWEGVYNDYNASTIERIARQSAELGISLFVNDDGWFGKTPYARVNDTAGLGDWTPNPDRFPNGFANYIDTATGYSVANASSRDLQFGLWFEPEMVNPNSTLYHEHPDWAMHSNNYPRTLTRNQLVLNVGLPEVQEFIINSVSEILDMGNISYIKWDNNRGMHEIATPAADYNYMLGMYNVINNLTTRYPDILWEGCASGGGRFDAGLLHYWPQSWTSDNNDAVDRLSIQMGTSLAYPLSSMGCHVGEVPYGLTDRSTSIWYRAHVALMCGSFGFELDPAHLSPDEEAAIPGILEAWEKVNPIVISGTFYRLAIPDETNWPAVQFISEDGKTVVVFAFMQKPMVKPAAPPLKMQGLDPAARYSSDGEVFAGSYSGATLMNAGVNLQWETTEFQSMMFFLYKE